MFAHMERVHACRLWEVLILCCSGLRLVSMSGCAMRGFVLDRQERQESTIYATRQSERILKFILLRSTQSRFVLVVVTMLHVWALSDIGLQIHEETCSDILNTVCRLASQEMELDGMHATD